MAPPGYKTISCPRTTHAGGVAFVIRDTLLPLTTTNTKFPFDHPSYEVMQLSINLRQQRLQFFLFYTGDQPGKSTTSPTASFIMSSLTSWSMSTH